MWPPDDLDQRVKGLLAHVADLCWCNVGWCAPPQTQILESWAVREAMSKVAVCAGAESACELATSMPRWASTWAWIMTVPCEPPPSTHCRVPSKTKAETMMTEKRRMKAVMGKLGKMIPKEG